MKKISRVIYRSLKKSIEQILDKKNEKNRSKFEKNVDQFSSIIIDSSNYLSEMCLLGEKYGTDKSVFNKKTKHQHSYTPIYNILFNHLKDQKINIAELGVAYSSSLRMFREYFKKANIDVFDNDENTLETSKNIKLSDGRRSNTRR